MLLSVSHFRGERAKKLFAGRKSFCGASRIAGFGEGTPQQVSREGQNRRIADFGTVVETYSVTATDCPCSGFSVHRANGTRVLARCSLSFFHQYDAGEGLRCPLAAAFSSFRQRYKWKAASYPLNRDFFFSLSTTPCFEICQISGLQKFPLTHYYTRQRGKMAESQNGQQKSSKSFSRLTAFAGRRWRLIVSF